MGHWVDVRKDHLVRGVPRRCRACPIYLAAEEVFGRDLLYVVSDGRINLRSPDRRHPFGEWAAVSEAGQRLLEECAFAVDHGLAEEVEPFRVYAEYRHVAARSDPSLASPTFVRAAGGGVPVRPPGRGGGRHEPPRLFPAGDGDG